MLTVPELIAQSKALSAADARAREQRLLKLHA
jgi:hypothetical protein